MAAGVGSNQEDLCWWESQGKKQPGRVIAIETRRLSDQVFAIIQPVEPVRQQAQRTEPNSLFVE